MNTLDVRQYMLMAADKIERFPTQFDFVRIRVPADRDGCGCALGWLGYFAGMRSASVEPVSQTLLGIDGYEFYCRMNALEGSATRWDSRAADCSKTLRRYADVYLPNPDHGPDEVNAVPVAKAATP